MRSAEVAGDKLGNLDSAAESLERALELQPNGVTILSQLERISVARRDWRRATAVSRSRSLSTRLTLGCTPPDRSESR